MFSGIDKAQQLSWLMLAKMRDGAGRTVDLMSRDLIIF